MRQVPGNKTKRSQREQSLKTGPKHHPTEQLTREGVRGGLRRDTVCCCGETSCLLRRDKSWTYTRRFARKKTAFSAGAISCSNHIISVGTVIAANVGLSRTCMSALTSSRSRMKASATTSNLSIIERNKLLRRDKASTSLHLQETFSTIASAALSSVTSVVVVISWFSFEAAFSSKLS